MGEIPQLVFESPNTRLQTFLRMSLQEHSKSPTIGRKNVKAIASSAPYPHDSTVNKMLISDCEADIFKEILE